MEKYLDEDDPFVIPPLTMMSRKSEKKRRASRGASMYEVDRGERVSKKSSIKGLRRRTMKRTTVAKKQLSMSEVTIQRSKQSISEFILADSLEKLKTRKKSKKKKRKGIRFVLPVPCKAEICRPKVCCWRLGERGRWKERSAIVRRSSEEDTSTTSIKSATSDWKFDKKTSVLLAEMRKPPTELTEDAARARAEIKIATTIPRGTKARRYVARLSTDTRYVDVL